ncbi:hypothetical protein BGZ54_004042 [Gamsiella multidivaricata]|nr:hypothetical protein BGZ54_004042 [Gamsiella multidivaricata]
MSMAQQELQRGQGHRGSWEKGVEGIADTVTALSIPASLRSVSLEPSSLLVLHSTPTLAVHTDPCYGGHKAAKVTPEAITEIEDAAQVEMEVLFPANNSDATQGKILPDTVLIHDLPEYFPDDGFGRNSRRYEKYARLRLVALREHQQALVRLLGELLDTDNLYRLSQDRLLPPVSTACPHDRIQESETGSSRNQCACHIRRVHRRQKRETAVSGYQKAILDLWQTDQNLCYWLSRYIRTTRRVGRSLDFILTSTGDSNPSTTAIAPLDQHKVGSNNGVSNPELERMGILQSRLLNYVACPASCTTSYVSTTLPPADELLKERCASTSRSKSRSNGKTVPQSTQSALSSITEVKEASMSFKKPTNDFARDPAQQSFSPADESAPLSQQSMALDASIPISVAIKDIPVIPAIVSKRIVVMTSRSIMASLPLSPLLPAPSTPPPAVPAPSPPRQYGTSPSPNLSATIQHPRSAPVHTPSQSQQPVQRQEMRQITTSGRVRTCFRDLDEFETAVFVGFHMQSLQKTNEFLHQFNKEAIRSRIMTERFKIARDMYEHRVMGRPWKTQQRKKELLRTKCSSNNV